jgi:hypothetical protein
MRPKAKAPTAAGTAEGAELVRHIRTATNIEPDAFRQVVCRLARRFSLTEPHARVVAELARLGGSAQ